MIIFRAKKIERFDIADYSWLSLRTFHNKTSTADAIARIHGLSTKHRKNAEKQADQIRFFLLQAREYFDASRAVTLVTKPALLYYSAMCLATAELLFKQSGDVSIDKARISHRHHGLLFSSKLRAQDRDRSISETGLLLLAQPAMRGQDERYGTFDLWHRSARPYPVVGPFTTTDSGSQTKTEGFGTLMTVLDERLPLIPRNGISLLETFRNIPGMAGLLLQYGVHSRLARAHASRIHERSTSAQVLQIIVQPGPSEPIDDFFGCCRFDANDIAGVEFKPFDSGGILTVRDTLLNSVRFTAPDCTSDKFPNTWFYKEKSPLNEFGYIYLALYIVGNYARYYPDFWIYDVEHNTQLGILVEHLLGIAEARIGLLTFSELMREFYVPV